LVGEGGVVTGVPLTQCQRCPKEIVVAANQLMALSGVEAMVPVSEVAANIHVITWKTPEDEAAGMAAALVKNICAHPNDRHLASNGHAASVRIFAARPYSKARSQPARRTRVLGGASGIVGSTGSIHSLLSPRRS